MNIFYLGEPPADFGHGEWSIPPRLLAGQPLFEVDALFVFAGKPLDPAGLEACKLVERSGRPVVRVGAVDVPLYRPAAANILMVREYTAEDAPTFAAWLNSRPRTNYHPIGCSVYDLIEAAIVTATEVEIIYRGVQGEATSLRSRLTDTKTHLQEEFVQLASGRWIRMDRLLSIGGELVTSGCTF